MGSKGVNLTICESLTVPLLALRHEQARCVGADLDKVSQGADLALTLGLEAGTGVGVLNILGALGGYIEW